MHSSIPEWANFQVLKTKNRHEIYANVSFVSRILCSEALTMPLSDGPVWSCLALGTPTGYCLELHILTLFFILFIRLSLLYCLAFLFPISLQWLQWLTYKYSMNIHWIAKVWYKLSSFVILSLHNNYLLSWLKLSMALISMNTKWLNPLY
jgi:hypothetical protein